MTDLPENNSATNEQLIRKLFKDSFVPEQTPQNFSQRVMSRVMYDWVLQSGDRERLLDRRNRYWIIPGVLLVLAAGYLMDVGRLGRQYINEEIWFQGFSDLGVTLFGWMGSMHWIVPVSLVAIGGLLFFDRLLQKLSRL